MTFDRKKLWWVAGVLCLVVAGYLGISSLVRSRVGEAARTTEPPRASPSSADPFARSERLNVVHQADARGDLELEGLVLASDSQPAPGATVAIDTIPPSIVRADEAGAFKIGGLNPREYSLAASSGGEVAGPLSIRLGQKTDPVVIKLRAGAQIEVSVVAAKTSAPVQHATVQLRGPMSKTATTNENGVATMVALPLGTQRIVAWADGFGRGEAPVFFGDDGRALAVKIALAAGTRVTGIVVGRNGSPIAGASVVLESAADPWWRPADSEDEVASDHEGKFAIEGVSAGGYRVRASHPAFIANTSALFTVVDDAVQTRVELEPGVTVRGTVMDADSKTPIGGARVRLSPEGVRGNPHEATTDSHGVFMITGIAPGRVEVAASSNDATSAVATLEVPDHGRDDVSITLENTGTIEGVVVDDTGDPLDAIQVSAWQDGGSAAWWDLLGLRRELTSSDGKFRITGLLRTGTYAVSADRTETIARGLGMRSAHRKVVPGTRDLRIVVSSPGALKGIVAYDDGSHPPAFTVRITGTVQQSRPFIGNQGAFEIKEVPPGDYTLAVEGPGFEPFHFDRILVASGKTTDLGTVPARPGRRIEGRVIDGSGRAVAGAKVAAGHLLVGTGTGDEEQGLFAGRSRNAETDDTGAFAVAGVGHGTVTVVASSPTAGSSIPIELPETGQPTQHVDIQLIGQGSVTGTVTDHGAPVANAMVTSQSSTAPMVVQMVHTGADGKYRFDRLAPDSYAVAVGLGDPMSGMRFVGHTATVAPGATATVDIVSAAGPASLAVTVDVGSAGRRIVMLFTAPGQLAATNVGQLLHAVTSRTNVMWAWNVGGSGQPINVTQLPPGNYTTCAVPFEVSSSALPDLTTLMRETDVAATCGNVDVAGASSITITVASK